MNKSDEIKLKIEKKTQEIEKRRNITESYKKKMAKSLDIFEKKILVDEIKTSENKEQALLVQLANLEQQLQKQLNKENVPKIPAIEALLDKWEVETKKHIEFCYKEKCHRKELYLESFNELEDLLNHSSHIYHRFCYDLSHKKLDANELKSIYTSKEGKYKLSEDIYNKMIDTYKLESKYKQYENDNFSYIELYYDEDKAKKFFRDEKIAKRLDLISRVTSVVGEIKDAKGLYFGYNEGINGIIIGSKGKAEISTIEAGGYNIQCYHFRVLVKKLKEKESNKDSLDKKIKEVKSSKRSASANKIYDIER